MTSRSVGMPSRNDKPPDIWDTHGISVNVFVKPTASSSAPFPQGFNPWISNVSEHTSPHVMSERQTPDTALDPRCQSGPSARNSFDPSEGRFSKDFTADHQRLQISELHFDKFTTPSTFACWKIRFKTEVCTCSQFPTEAVHWNKEVEMVDSVERGVHRHQTHDAVDNELFIGALVVHLAPRRCVQSYTVQRCRMSKTRWVRVRVVEKKVHVRRKSTI